MLHGLMWLPLLALFFGLAWAGWSEYRKVEAYKLWAVQFERAKYDIYAALGQKHSTLMWGVPTRQGIVQTESLDLKEAIQMSLEVDSSAIIASDFTQADSADCESETAAKIEIEDLPKKGRYSIGFDLPNGQHVSIPFTNAEMAYQWYAALSRLQTQFAVHK